MSDTRKILIMGASYGSLLSTKLLCAGHTIKLVCRAASAHLIDKEGTRVRIPVKGRKGLIVIDSRSLPGKLSAGVPSDIDPTEYDLVVLAMQEPQYHEAALRQLLDGVAKAGVPCMSIMNMPPLPCLQRLPGISADACRSCYVDPTVWDRFVPESMTLCSPDPQAFRPLDEKTNVLQVSLPTNFKAARFDSDAYTALLRQLQLDIEAVRFEAAGDKLELPVKLIVHESGFVPLAKWAMLLTGNYRCIQKDGIRSICAAVHTDIEASRAIYKWVIGLCVAIGASEKDLVPFNKYASAAQALAGPSSVARALVGGATHIERVDRLVQTISAQKGMRSNEVDEVVASVDRKLETNRKMAS